MEIYFNVFYVKITFCIALGFVFDITFSFVNYIFGLIRYFEILSKILYTQTKKLEHFHIH